MNGQCCVECERKERRHVSYGLIETRDRGSVTLTKYASARISLEGVE